MVSCTLSADQEIALNRATTRYLDARNNGEIMSYVSLTYPKAVSFYKQKGDDAFKAKFGSDSTELSFIQDGNIRVTSSTNNVIHVKYSFLKIIGDPYGNLSEEIFIYAISEDDGRSWMYLDEIDYLNDEILTSNERLIE